MQGEVNALVRIAKGPFSDFKEGGFGSVLEEVLGRLRVLRRNQRVLNIKYPATRDIYACVQLFEEYELNVVNVENADTIDIEKVLKDNNFPPEFPLMMIDTLKAWVSTQYKPMVVAIKLSEVTLEEYKKSVEVSRILGYLPVSLVDGIVIFVRSDLAHDAGVKGVNKRNFEILFYDQ